MDIEEVLADITDRPFTRKGEGFESAPTAPQPSPPSRAPLTRSGALGTKGSHMRGSQTSASIPHRSSVLPASSALTQRPRSRWAAPLIFSQQLEMTREERIRQRWEKQRREWDEFAEKVSARLGKPKEQLVMHSWETHRELMEEVEALDRLKSTTQLEVNNPDAWRMMLRNGGSRYVLLGGNLFAGLWMEVKERPQHRSKSETVRRIPEHKEGDEYFTRSRPGTSRRSKSPLLRHHLHETLGGRHIDGLGNFTVKELPEDALLSLAVVGQPLIEWALTARPMDLAEAPALSQEEQGRLFVPFSTGQAAIQATEDIFRPRPRVSDASAVVSTIRPSRMGSAAWPELAMGQSSDIIRQSALVDRKWLAVMAADELPRDSDYATEVLAPGPHAHMQIISDAITRDGDIGAAIGHSGSLPAVRRDATDSRPSTADSLAGGSGITVTLHASADQIASAKVLLVNTGTTALQFEWLRQPLLSALSEGGVLTEDQAQSPRFVCSAMNGTLLPGMVVELVFTFAAHCPGTFRELWQLETIPNLANVQGQPSLILRGVCAARDESGPRRQKLDSKLKQASTVAFVRELVLGLVQQLELPQRPEPVPIRQARERKHFEAENPGLWYHADVYEALNNLSRRVAQAIKASVHHEAQPLILNWHSRLSTLEKMIDSLQPFPETAEEAAAAQEEESRLRVELRAKHEAEAAAAKAKAEAEAAAMSKKKGGAAKAAPVAKEKDKNRPASSVSPSLSRPAPGTPQASNEGGDDEFDVPLALLMPGYCTPAERRMKLALEQRREFKAELAELAAHTLQKPLDRSELWSSVRDMILDMANLVPDAAGAVRAACAAELRVHEVRSAAEDQWAWSDTPVQTCDRSEILTIVFGKRGPPHAKQRKTRQKLGRDGILHDVPLDDDEDEEDEDQDDDDVDLDELDPVDAVAREPWAKYKKRADAFKQKQLAEAKAKAEAQAAAEAEAAKSKKNKAPAPGTKGEKAGVAEAPAQASPPPPSPEEVKAAETRERLEWTVKRLLSGRLSKLGEHACEVEQQRSSAKLQKAGICQSQKASSNSLHLKGAVMMVRAAFDQLPSELCAAAVNGGAALSMLTTFTEFQEVVSEINCCLQTGASIVTVLGANGIVRPPYLDEIASQRGLLHDPWPPIPDGEVVSASGWLGQSTGGRVVPAECPKPGNAAALLSIAASSPRSPREGAIADVMTECSVRYRVPSFAGIASCLSTKVQTPVLLLDPLSLFSPPQIYFDGNPVSRESAAFGSAIWPVFTALDYAMEEVADHPGWARFTHFVRRLAEVSPPVTLLCENLFSSGTLQTILSEVNVAGISRDVRDAPFGTGLTALDAISVEQWSSYHVCLWLASLCPGISHKAVWRLYCSSFAGAAIEGKHLISWGFCAHSACSKMLEKAEPEPPKQPMPLIAAEAPATSVPKRKGSGFSTSSSGDLAAAVMLANQPSSAVLLFGLSSADELLKAWRSLGVTSLAHQRILFSALERLILRHQAESLAKAHQRAILRRPPSQGTMPPPLPRDFLSQVANAAAFRAAVSASCDGFVSAGTKQLSLPSTFDSGVIPFPDDEGLSRPDTRVLGLTTAKAISVLERIISANLDHPGSRLLVISSDVHNLVQRAECLLRATAWADTIAIGGVLAVAWAALVTFELWGGPLSTTPPPQSVDSTVPPSPAPGEKKKQDKAAAAVTPTARLTLTITDELRHVFKSTASLCGAAWFAAADILCKVRAETIRRGIVMIEPKDFVVADTIFDPLMFNPTAASTQWATLAKYWSKRLPTDELEESQESEDERPDEDYDSDDSADMRELSERNKRRTEKLAQAEAAKRKAERVADAAAGLHPLLAEEWIPGRSGWRGRAGCEYTLVDGNSFIVPTIEPSLFEFDVDCGARPLNLPKTDEGSRPADAASGVVKGRGEAVIDVGAETLELILERVASAGVVVVYGPLGVVELADGAAATLEVLKAMAQQKKSGKSITCLLGGALTAFLRRTGVTPADFTVVDVGLGALLEGRGGRVLKRLSPEHATTTDE